MRQTLAAASDLLGLGTDRLHDAGVLLSLLLLAWGMVALGVRIAAALRRKPALASLQIYRMLAILGALGGFGAYLRELSYSHGARDLALGGLAALPWMSLVVLETMRRPRGRQGPEPE